MAGRRMASLIGQLLQWLLFVIWSRIVLGQTGGFNDSNWTEPEVEYFEGQAAFERYGDGDCMAAGNMPMRGRSRRDLSHGECRNLCNTQDCNGYSYAPCERICELHGEPDKFLWLEDLDNWGVKNGAGLITTSSGRCGSACFVRKSPCEGSTLTSAGAYIDYSPVTFATTRELICPFPHKGTVTIRCTPSGIAVDSGRCLRPCESGMVTDQIFTVQYPPTLDGELGVGKCPPGTLGNMTISCRDGIATHVKGRCGTNCPAGSLKSGTASVRYGGMVHEAMGTLKCPDGWVGSVRVECVNALIFLRSGECNRHCDAGYINTTTSGSGVPAVSGWATHNKLLHGAGTMAPCNSSDGMLTGELMVFCKDGNVSAEYSQGYCKRHCFEGTIGEGTRNVEFGIIEHDGNVTLGCNEGFDGFFDLVCDDGVVTHRSGYCYMNCEPGNVTSNNVQRTFGYLIHDANESHRCPEHTHNGTLVVTCDDGTPRFTGFCGRNCPGGSLPSNSAIVDYGSIRHAVSHNISCPYPWGSYLTLRCYDGSIRQTGRCGQSCPGSTVAQNGAIIVYPDLDHESVQEFDCKAQFVGALSFTGSLFISCYDGVISTIGACYADCSPGTIRNNGAKIISTVLVPSTKSLDLTCEPRPAYGRVTVTCLEGFLVVTKGSCGLPCVAGPFSSYLTRHTDVDLPEVWHDEGIWKDCPQDLSGQVWIKCTDGILRVQEGECGERCASESLVVYGASFVSPLLDHNEIFLQPCLPPYSGVANATCIFGQLHVVSKCERGCFAGMKVLPGGATVPHPDLVSGDKSSPECPEGYVGEVTLVCVDGTMEVYEGACNSHCAADRFTGPSGYEVQYGDILHNGSTWVSCPSGYVGNIMLRCDGGLVTIQEGSCPRNCQSGKVYVRDGVTLSFDQMKHGELSKSKKCPNAYTGSIVLICDDSEVKVESGVCLKHCGNGNAQGATYRTLEHEDLVSLTCPEVGEVRVKCFDGDVTVLSGACLYGCKKGNMEDVHGITVAHDDFNHDSVFNGTCSEGGLGTVELYCYDKVITVMEPLQANRCERHCNPQITTARDGTDVMSPYIEHLQSDMVPCPNGTTGVLSLRCDDGTVTVYDGVCGDMNCRAGEVMSNEAVLSHNAINDLRTDGPGDCGSDFMGQPVFLCQSGVTTVLDVTLVMQPRAPGDANVDELGPAYDFIEDDRFLLCGCCLPPGSQPGVDSVMGDDSRNIMYWAIAVGSSGLVLSFFSGIWILSQKSPPKISKVIPEEAVVQGTAAIQDIDGKFALGDFDADKAALRDAVDAPPLQLMPDAGEVHALQDQIGAEPVQENTALALAQFMGNSGNAPTSPTSPAQASRNPQMSQGQMSRSPPHNSRQASRSHVKQLPKPIRETSSAEWKHW
mmetsp:Transcript_50847/g.91400  ORF Transcript_50847/g.91400 Transcript_50847/m.91400 type:complete len:1384 (+) Transcript_50847:47-4198(+)